MIVPPQTLTFHGAPAPELQLQQAGFDLSVAKVERFIEHVPVLQNNIAILDLDNSVRRLPQTQALDWRDDGSIELHSAGNAGNGVACAGLGYLVTYNETITVPPDCAGMVLPRSSLMRCGAVLHSALWDPGYCGKGQGLLVVYHTLKLYRDARIAQFVLWRMEQPAAKLYEGKYQGENL